MDANGLTTGARLSWFGRFYLLFHCIFISIMLSKQETRPVTPEQFKKVHCEDTLMVGGHSETGRTGRGNKDRSPVWGDKQPPHRLPVVLGDPQGPCSAAGELILALREVL